MNPDSATCYKILNLPNGASFDEIKKARRTLAKKWHPDLVHGNSKLYKQHEEKLKQVNLAHDILESQFRNGNTQASNQEAAKPTAQQNEENQKAKAKHEAREREERRARAEKETKRNAKQKEKERTRQLRKIFLKFQRLAKRGIAEAQYRLAMLYRNGHGCVQNKVEASRWFKKAAAAGDSRSIIYLGFAFAWGIGVATDKLKAIQLYESAAEKGLAEAYFHLGFMHYFGIGIKQDFEHAKQLYLKAIEHGYQMSDRILDTCGHLRTETPKEYFKQYKWYVLGVKRAASG